MAETTLMGVSRSANLNHSHVLQALCGTILEIPCLDGRQLAIPVTQVVAPGYTKKWPGEGMPKEDGTKGNLLIKFDIQFPETLTPAQKTTIKKTLAQ